MKVVAMEPLVHTNFVKATIELLEEKDIPRKRAWRLARKLRKDYSLRKMLTERLDDMEKDVSQSIGVVRTNDTVLMCGQRLFIDACNSYSMPQ